MNAWTDLVLDNPILTKHARTRLRRGQLMSWLSVVIVLCLAVVWAGQAFNGLDNGAALAFLLGLQTILLVFIGATQIGGAVGGARESGIIDFHRVAPVPPGKMALGYLLGAPIREYLLFAATLPFAAGLGVVSTTGFWGWLALTVPLVVSAWLLHCVSMLSALSTRKPKGTGKGAGAGVLVFGLIFGQWIGMGLWSVTRRMQGDTYAVQFFGLKVPWLAFLLFYEAVLLGFLFLACARKMRAERVHAYSKAQALAFMASITLLVLGAAWNFQGQKEVVLVVLYFLLIAAIVLSVTITPDQTEYVRAVRRALRVGRHRPTVWEDSGTNRLALFGLCALVFLGATLSWELIAGRTQGDASVYSQTIAIGVFTVAYFGLGLQFFQLRMAKSGSSLFTLFLFVVWLMPVLLGSIAFGASVNREVAQMILCFSPMTGIAMSSGLIEETTGRSFKLAALAPAITFAFIFNYLLVATQRKLDLTVRTLSPQRHEPGPFDDLDRSPGAKATLDEIGVS